MSTFGLFTALALLFTAGNPLLPKRAVGAVQQRLVPNQHWLWIIIDLLTGQTWVIRLGNLPV